MAANDVGSAPAVPEKPADRPPWRLFWPSPKTVRHVVVEVLIVAVGVLLALGIDQWRQHLGRLAQAEETRQLLKEEVRRNLNAVEQGMRDLSSVYDMIEDEPEQAPSLLRAAGRGIPTLIDTAYEVARQTGTFSYLRPEERKEIAEAYRVMEAYEFRRRDFADAFTRLAVYPAGTLADANKASARLEQTRLSQILAGAVFGHQCRMTVRFRVALNELEGAVGYCNDIYLPTDVEAVIAGRYEPPVTDAPPQPDAAN